MDHPFAHLLEPGCLGTMKVRNRIVMPAMRSNFATADGLVTTQLTDYYEERARGGAGAIIVEACCVDSSMGRHGSRQLRIDEDRYVPGLGRLAHAMRKHGAGAILQLQHAGGRGKRDLTGREPAGPSAITMPNGESCRELAVAEIEDIVDHFAQAALRAKQARFDAVEIHGGHAYLIAQFLSPYWNRRQDRYGGEIGNRARLLLEIVVATKAAVGTEYPVLCRINGEDSSPGGQFTTEDAQRVAQMLERVGVDGIHVSAWPIPAFRFPPMSEPIGSILPLATNVKQAVRLPVIAVGRVTPDLAEQALGDGQVDFVAMGRALVADPWLPSKLRSGRLDEVTPCIGCVRCHFARWDLGPEEQRLRCTVNPAVGRERTCRVRVDGEPGRVLVVGGGPAGMMAAITAARRGHRVVLCERLDRLGGQLNLAVVPPHKHDLEPLLDYLIREIQSLRVEVVLDTEVTVEYIRELAPGVVVVATGAAPLIPQISGVTKSNVVHAHEVLSGARDVGSQVVVIGGQLVACETAELLAERGKRVTILGRSRPIGQEIRPQHKKRLMMERLTGAGVRMDEHVEVDRIEDDGVHCRQDGRDLFLPADTVVLATGTVSMRELGQELAAQGLDVRFVGDCVAPRTLTEAVEEGFLAGLGVGSYTRRSMPSQ